jgi:alkanesulfonate monooxygenase
VNVASRHIRLGLFVYPAGHHLAAWRSDASVADAGMDFASCLRIAQTAERGLMDMIFLSDVLAALPRPGENLAATARMSNFAHFEPITLLSALAPLTGHIGLVATATTTYNEPFHIARKFASLDLLSGGRAGWNLVTSSSPAEAFNFSRDAHLQHGNRYRRAQEFAEIVLGLWDSWDEDAFLFDKASGRFFDPDRLRILRHRGEHFSVQGPLSLPRSPQGAPVLVQAGSSEDGRALAAETAEVIFTAHITLASAQAFYRDIKDRAARLGRDPDGIKVMPGVSPVIGASETEARQRFQHLQELIHPEVGLTLLSRMTGVDLSGHDLDGPMPPLPEVEGGRSRSAMLSALAQEQALTIRQMYQHVAGARGHWQIFGTPSQIADQLEEWFVQEGADGFNLMPPSFPDDLDRFVELVVPELQRRGLYRRSYAGRTLRDNLGLAVPPNGWRARNRD